MDDIIKDKKTYYDFFKFHRYYTFQAPAENVDTDPLCGFCAFVNDETVRNTRRTYAQFRKWWNRVDEKINETVGMIVQYESSGSRIKGLITYREKNVKINEGTTHSAIESVGNFVDDLINYYFQKK